MDTNLNLRIWMKASLRVASVVLTLSVLALLLPLRWFQPSALSHWLEDATGESDLRQQLEGLVLLFNQRGVNTKDLVPIANTGMTPFGANTFFEQEVEEAKIRKSMEMLREAGILWIRQQVPWSQVERQGKGVYDWSHFDRIFALAKEHGLEVVARLDLPPIWARAGLPGRTGPPQDYGDYGDFIHTLVSRYQGQVRYIQIWNEPNLADEWNGGPPDAAEYVALLRVAYQRAKEADPDVVVLSAPLAPTVGTPDGLNESDLTYLQKMYDAGARDYFDILSAQAYGLWTGPGDRRAQEDRINFSRVRLIRETMVRNGDAHKATWVSEMGWSALPQDFPAPAVHGRVTEERQARYTAAAYRRIQEEWPWVGVVFYWYFRHVSDEKRGDINYYFRMVEPDFTPLPVYFSVKELAQSEPVMGYGRHQEDHRALFYRGDWRRVVNSQAELGVFMEPREDGAEVSFAFKGSSLTLVTAKGPKGTLCATVDGSPRGANSLKTDESGSGCINLLSERTVWGVEVPITAGLPDSEHQVTLTIHGGPVVVDGFIVNRPQLSLAQQVTALLLLAGSALALTLGLIMNRERGARNG